MSTRWLRCRRLHSHCQSLMTTGQPKGTTLFAEGNHVGSYSCGQQRTVEAIMQMPAALWRKLELASVLMDLDADLTRPPCFEAEG